MSDGLKAYREKLESASADLTMPDQIRAEEEALLYNAMDLAEAKEEGRREGRDEILRASHALRPYSANDLSYLLSIDLSEARSIIRKWNDDAGKGKSSPLL